MANTPSYLLASSRVYEASLFQILNRQEIIFRAGTQESHESQKRRDGKLNPQLRLVFIVFSWQQEGEQRDIWKKGILLLLLFLILRREGTYSLHLFCGPYHRVNQCKPGWTPCSTSLNHSGLYSWPWTWHQINPDAIDNAAWKAKITTVTRGNHLKYKITFLNPLEWLPMSRARNFSEEPHRTVKTHKMHIKIRLQLIC